MKTLIRIAGALKAACRWLGRRRAALDANMREKYKPWKLALIAEIAVAAALGAMLFLPPYLGLSNDGSYDTVMQDVGLKRLDENDPDPYYDYYERTYRIEQTANAPGTTSALLRTVIRAAIKLDTALTGDLFFDLRFLALIYCVLYLLALYPTLRHLTAMAPLLSEGLLIALLGVLVFGDVSIGARFASFGREPLELIALLGCLDGCFLFCDRERFSWTGLLLLTLCSAALMNVNAFCGAAGIAFSIFLWAQAAGKNGVLERGAAILCAGVVTFAGVSVLGGLFSGQTRMQKYHQMTRGVLLQSADPAQTLESFGISPRYSILADTWGDQNYPVVLVESGVLDKGFLDRYDTAEVAAYYLAHPENLLSLLDSGVHAAFVTRSEYSGNYEKSVGLPARAKSPLMALWSTFKSRSAPRTVAFFLLLSGGCLALYAGRSGSLSEREKRARYQHLSTLSVLIVFAALEILTVTLVSGDSELMTEGFMMGCCMDLLFLLFCGRVMHRLNIA